MSLSFDITGYTGYLPLGNPALAEYESRKPAYFRSIAKARGYELGKALLLQKPNWAGVKQLDSSECAYYLMMKAPDELELKDDLTNPYDIVIKAMSYVPGFFDDGAATICKMKGFKGMKYLRYEPTN